jgi:hypothetical protein
MSVLFIIICGILLSAMSLASNTIGLDCLENEKQTPRYQFLVFNIILAAISMCVCVAGLIFFVKMDASASVSAAMPVMAH